VFCRSIHDEDRTSRSNDNDVTFTFQDFAQEIDAGRSLFPEYLQNKTIANIISFLRSRYHTGAYHKERHVAISRKTRDSSRRMLPPKRISRRTKDERTLLREQICLADRKPSGMNECAMESGRSA